MNTSEVPSVEKLRAPSDLEEKLVIILVGSSDREVPAVKFWMVNCEPIPKLGSAPSFRKTLSEESSATAVPPPGRVLPTVMPAAGPVLGAKKLSLTNTSPPLKNWAEASWP